MTRLALVLAIALVAVACGGRVSLPTSTPPQTPPPTLDVDRIAGEIVLAHGEVFLPAADGFNSRGFHEALEFGSLLPSSVPDSDGMRIVVRLRDVGRPAQTCDSDHPLSGCATVDWSDFPDRPGVPADGVLLSTLTLPMVDGTRTLYLSERDGLVEVAPAYAPG